MEKNNAVYEKFNKHDPGYVNIFKLNFSREEERIRQRHWHRSLEISYHENIDGVICIDGQDQKITGNMIVLINSRCVHEIRNKVKEGSSSTVLIIPYELLKTEIPGFDDLFFIVESHDETLIKLLKEMSEIQSSGLPNRNLKLKSLQYELLFYLCNNCCTQKEGTLPHNTHPKQDWTYEVAQYIYNNYSRITSINDVSDYFNYTVEAFCRKFRQVFHCTVHQYITRIRLLHAIPQIRANGIPYSEIAANCGFPNIRSFKSSLLSYTGYTITEISALSLKERKTIAENISREHFA